MEVEGEGGRGGRHGVGKKIKEHTLICLTCN